MLKTFTLTKIILTQKYTLTEKKEKNKTKQILRSFV